MQQQREHIKLTLDKRTVLGKKTANLRRAGVTPVHLYGREIQSESLQAKTQDLIRAMSRAGANTPIRVTVEGNEAEQLAFVREVQWDPIKGNLLHVDLLGVSLTQRTEAEVPIELVGEAPAVRAFRGTLVQHMHTLTVEALPLEIPHRIDVDISVLTDLDKEIRVRDLTLPPGVTVISDLEELIARVELVKVEEEAVAAAPEAAPEEAAPAAEAPESEEKEQQ